MKRQILAMAFAFTALFIGTSSVPVSAAPVSADYKVTAAPSIPISGTVAGISSFVGNFDIQRFTSRSGGNICSRYFNRHTYQPDHGSYPNSQPDHPDPCR